MASNVRLADVGLTACLPFLLYEEICSIGCHVYPTRRCRRHVKGLMPLSFATLFPLYTILFVFIFLKRDE